MTGRILLIASWDGPRRSSTHSNAQMLKQHYLTLLDPIRKLRHQLDKVVVVVNGGQGPPILDKFPDKLLRENTQGSYGAWRDGILAYPGYEWYFFLEDDYLFFEDDFDQTMIDMWTPETTYLAGHVGRTPVHAMNSNGLIRGDIIPTIDWKVMGADPYIYNDNLQINWGTMFGSDGLRDIRGKYDVPFWNGANVDHTDPSKPVLFGPIQLLTEREITLRRIEAIPKELMYDRHRERLATDAEYRARWGDDI